MKRGSPGSMQRSHGHDAGQVVSGGDEEMRVGDEGREMGRGGLDCFPLGTTACGIEGASGEQLAYASAATQVAGALAAYNAGRFEPAWTEEEGA